MSQPKDTTTPKLTEYQAGQLLHLHLAGDFKYKTDARTRVPRAQWRKMLDTLHGQGLISYEPRLHITPEGRAYLDQHHLEIPSLS